MLKQPNFLYSQDFTLLKEALTKFYLSMTFGLSFMIRSVASTGSLTFYTKIGNRNLNSAFTQKVKVVQLSALISTRLSQDDQNDQTENGITQ